MRIGIVATASRLDEETAGRVAALAARDFGARAELLFHPQCFASWGHFAGDDAQRAAAFAEVANDPACDAVWFARGGYGSARIIDQVLPSLAGAARQKLYLGYSDAGALLAALRSSGIGRLAHGPMPADIRREGGEGAVRRALSFLLDSDLQALEPDSVAAPSLAFNITILAHLMGTPWSPNLEGRVLMLEEVSEHHYRIDRALGQIFSTPMARRLAGVRLGRCSLIPPNEPDFGQSEEEICRFWCARAGVPCLGRADIGHDVANKVVPFDWPWPR